MATFAQSNNDNFLTWQKVTGVITLTQLQARGIPSCSESYSITDITFKKDISVGGGGVMTSIYWSSDGLDFYFVGTIDQKLYQKSVSTPHDISTVIATQTKTIAEDTTLVDARFNSDGTKCYISGAANDTIFQYVLSTGWDVSTLSYDSKSIDCSGKTSSVSGFCMSETNVYVSTGTSILQYSITGGDLSTSSFVYELPISEDTAVFSMAYRSDSKLYFTGTSTDKVFELSIASGNIIRGMVTASQSVVTKAANPVGIFFDTGGFTMWIMDSADDLSEYWVECP